MPVLKEVFQRLLEQPQNTCDVVVHIFTEFCSRAALAIQDFGLVQEFCSKVPLWHISSRRTILGALLQDIMLRDIPQPILSRLLKPPLTATSEAGGGLDKTNKGKQPKGQAPGLMENVSVPKLTPDILVLLQIEDQEGLNDKPADSKE
ncbi:hypothetical protein, conserved [Eimeria necatrix]|uniref:Uncharacterized protein n=1 Tax=Eimeria necatrix TaxID=51315 RepID=U6MHW4_9EIME|nr:hypothetical protein, conserved [Eimeria necatrix]CDJ62658.1 hypothetical protein, conserved [Eimeria necatrix]